MAGAQDRRCVISGTSQPRGGLIRLVIGPDDRVVPDVAAKLPGRGVWISADGALVRSALKDGRLKAGISRSLKCRIDAAALADDLADTIETLLERRALDRLGLLKRSNALVVGQEKIRDALVGDKDRSVALVLSAQDAAAGSTEKVKRSLHGRCALLQPFDRDALSQALGGENIVHVLVWSMGGTEELTADLSRLEGMRNHPQEG